MTGPDPSAPAAAGPTLSVVMPTANRPALLERALTSLVEAAGPQAWRIHVAVSDGSSGPESGKLVRDLLRDWPGGVDYVRHDPQLPQIANINTAIGMARAPWILQLHDDDYLLPGAGPVMLAALDRARAEERVYLFGVWVVDEQGTVRRRQEFPRDSRLAPDQALRRLLRTSSFVRQPAVVIHERAYRDHGLYDASIGSPVDTDMYVRLFSRYGVHCIARTTSAYMVHSGATTTGMWNPETIAALQRIFATARERQVVPERDLRRWQADFFHQFILAGAYRRLRAGNRRSAREALALFRLPSVRALGPSPRWLAARAAFTLASRVPR